MKIRTNIRAGVVASPRCGGRCAPVPRCSGTPAYDLQ